MARDLPRQLRLRGLGGQIVIDPAPMPKKDRKTVESALGRAAQDLWKRISSAGPPWA